MARSLGYLLLLGAQLASAGPISSLLHTIDIGELKDVVWPVDRPHPVHLTTTPSGQKIAWVDRETQAGPGIKIAKAPKPPAHNLAKRNNKLVPELAEPDVERGPEGTVPFLVLTKEEYKKIPKKQPNPYFSGQNKKHSKRQDLPHYYGNSAQSILNYGASCVLSLFSPTVQGGSSESLIQVGIGNSQRDSGVQTVEAGWQVEPALNNGESNPHIFVYFTTNGYAQEGDYLGGYNTNQAGWVQTDSSQYPGFTFSTISTVGGTQYDTPLSYEFTDGNWWLTVNGVQMGYLNGSMYGASPSLAYNSDAVHFYGEVADATAPPTSQMGSGQFAETGSGNSAYINNMLVTTDTSGTTAPYNGGAGDATDTSCYTINTFPDNTDSRGSYMFVGGPGCPT